MDSYLTNCVYLRDRLPRHQRGAENASHKFEYVDLGSLLHGFSTISDRIVVHKETRDLKISYSLMTDCHGDDSQYVTLMQAAPSALIMYRLACLFDGRPYFFGGSGYKIAWTFSLRHLETQSIITLGDWKGGVTFWSDPVSDDGPCVFRDDIFALISLLIGDACPHPYDGVIAGSVA